MYYYDIVYMLSVFLPCTGDQQSFPMPALGYKCPAYDEDYGKYTCSSSTVVFLYLKKKRKKKEEAQLTERAPPFVRVTKLPPLWSASNEQWR